MKYYEAEIPYKVALNPIAISPYESGGDYYVYVFVTNHNFEEYQSNLMYIKLSFQGAPSIQYANAPEYAILCSFYD